MIIVVGSARLTICIGDIVSSKCEVCTGKNRVHPYPPRPYPYPTREKCTRPVPADRKRVNPRVRVYPQTPSHYLLDTPSFYQSMTELHFSLLQRFLHFVDNELLVGEGEKTRKLLKLKPIMDKFRDKFKELYIPERDVSVDESLMLWKGRLAFKQYIQSNELGLESSPTRYDSLKMATYGILWCILELTLILVLQFLICLMLTELLCLFCNHCWIKVTIFLS